MNRNHLFLALALVAVVASSWGWWSWRSATLKRPRPNRSAVANPTPAQTTKPSTPPTRLVNASSLAEDPHPATNSPAYRLDMDYLRRHAASWVAEPGRDPFQITRVKAAEALAPESPVNQFRLVATWLQSGSRLAVIDQRVYREGELLQGYRIVRIEPAIVHVQGRERAEQITFNSYRPEAPKTTWIPTNVGEIWLGPEREKLF